MYAQLPTAVITADAKRNLLQACQAAPETEACGILACRQDDPDRIVSFVLPIANVHPQPADNYAFSPQQWVQAWYDLQRQGLVPAGFYHSHPRTPAYPSDIDRSHPIWRGTDTNKPSAYSGELDLWILSLMQPDNPEIAVFRPTTAGLRRLVLTEISV